MTDRFATYPSLKDRAVIVTGGASGIGAAMVERFAEQGARVGFIDIAEDQGKTLEKNLRDKGAEANFAACDLRDPGALRDAIADLEKRSGPTHALVNNAAHDERHDWRTVTPVYWDGRMAVNLRHYFFAIQSVAPGMLERNKGSIVNFGSVSWMIKQGNMSGYTTAKAATHGMTRGFMMEFGQSHVRINTVIPGWVMTERQRELWFDEEGRKERDANQAMKGDLEPVDLANMVLFLTADDSKMCSGHEFFVDGGWR